MQGFYDGSVPVLHAWLNNGGNCSTTGCAWTPADQYAPPVYFTAHDAAGHSWDHGVRIVDLDGEGLPDLLYGFDSDPSSEVDLGGRAAWRNTGMGWTQDLRYSPPTAFTARDAGAPSGADRGARLLDLDGDGKPDMLLKGSRCWPGASCVTHAMAYINTGAGWVESARYRVPDPAYFAVTDSEGHSFDGGLRSVDLNGDMLSDLLWSLSDESGVHTAALINTGSGWLVQTGPDGYSPRSAAMFAFANDWSALDPTQTCPTFELHVGSGSFDGGLRIVDLNLDGKPDLLGGAARCDALAGFYAGSWINNGRDSFEQDGYYSSKCASPGFVGDASWCHFGGDCYGAQYEHHLADLDGDGGVDSLGGSENGATARTFARSDAFLDLMTSVSNGLGGTVTASYAPAPQLDGAILPGSSGPGIPNTWPQQLVTRVVTTDGRGGSYATHYSYHDARFYPGTLAERRNLGFAYIDAADEQTGQWTRTYYNQAPVLEGHVAESRSYTGANQLIEHTIFAYDLVNPSVGTELVRERQRETTTFEPTSTSSYASSQTTATDYDDYGNVTVSTQSADNLPTVTVTTTYDNDPANWILGRVRDVKTSSGGATLSEIQYTWTANSITEKREWLDTSGSWLTTAMTYDANGNLTSATEPTALDGLLRRTRLEYDPTYNAYPFTVTNALGQSSSMRYYPDGQIESVTDANGNVVKFEYDVFGRIQRETRPDEGTTSYTYDSWGDPNTQWSRVCVALNPNQTTCTERYFDGAGFAYRETSSGSGAQSVSVTHCKDVAGRSAASSVPYFGANVVNCGDPSTSWTTVTYDGASRVSSVTKPDATVTHLSYGPNPGATPACPSALATCMQDPNGQVTVRTVDARRKVTSIVDAARQTTSYGYEPLGRLTSVTLPNGQVFSATYDSLNRRTSTADSRLETTALGYDAVGNLMSVVSAGKAITLAYDALGRLVRKQAGDEPAVTYTYDEPEFANGKGRLTTVVDQAGTTHFAYTAMGFLNNFVRSIDGSEYSQYFTYDSGGRITRVTYPDQTSHADYAYTNEGNLASVALNDTDLATWSNYTASGRPQNVRYGNGVSTTYGYDTVNHLASLATVRGDTILQNLSYDWYSRPNTAGLNLGSITDNRPGKVAADGSITDETQTYTYDPLYRLTEATGAWGATTPNTYVQKKYEYDSIGNPTTFGGVTDRTLTFNGQQVDTVTGLDGVAWSYTWTAENRLASATKDGGLTAKMTYDFSGDRVKKEYTPASGPTVTTTYIGKMYERRTYSDGSPDRNTVYVFANGQLLASVTTAGRVATALRDANRWKSEMAATTTYSWRDARGVSQKVRHFLKALSLHPRAVTWILFTLYGVFVIVVVVAYLAAPSTCVSAMSGFSPNLRPVSLVVLVLFTFTGCGGPDAASLRVPRNYLIAGDTTNGPALGTYFYHRNHISSNSVITDPSGNEVTRLVYLPFGELSRANSSGTDTVTSKFTGQEYDEELGLYYYGARYYDPKVGRFLSPDPFIGDIGDPQSFNRYSYVANNPVKYIDPTGYQGCPADICTSYPGPGDPGGPGYVPGTYDPARPGAHDPVYLPGQSPGSPTSQPPGQPSTGGPSSASPPPPKPLPPTPFMPTDTYIVEGMPAPPADALLGGTNSAGGSSTRVDESVPQAVAWRSYNIGMCGGEPMEGWRRSYFDFQWRKAWRDYWSQVEWARSQTLDALALTNVSPVGGAAKLSVWLARGLSGVGFGAIYGALPASSMAARPIGASWPAVAVRGGAALSLGVLSLDIGVTVGSLPSAGLLLLQTPVGTYYGGYYQFYDPEPYPWEAYGGPYEWDLYGR